MLLGAFTSSSLRILMVSSTAAISFKFSELLQFQLQNRAELKHWPGPSPFWRDGEMGQATP
eukprot:2203496-Amphidinium_carterae.2